MVVVSRLATTLGIPYVCPENGRSLYYRINQSSLVFQGLIKKQMFLKPTQHDTGREKKKHSLTIRCDICVLFAKTKQSLVKKRVPAHEKMEIKGLTIERRKRKVE